MNDPACVIAVPNISEGRRADVVAEIAADPLLLDVHSDPDHNRSVMTYAGPPGPLSDACVAMTERAVAHLDLRRHEGVHPRFGVVDVCPFVSYLCDEDRAIEAARRYAVAAPVPIRLYGRVDPDERALPELRRVLRAEPPGDAAGVVCVGVRGPLLAFNVNLRGDLDDARSLARELRRTPGIRALALAPTRNLVQISTNLVDPMTVGPRAAFDRVRELLSGTSLSIVDAEVVGLVPGPILAELGSIPLRAPARSVEEVIRDKGIDC